MIFSMKTLYTKALIFSYVILASISYAQNNVGIGTTTPHSSSVLDVSSNSKGMLVPRLTSLQRNSISSPANGLLVYDIDLSCFYFYKYSQWVSLCQIGGGSGISSVNWSCNPDSTVTSQLDITTTNGVINLGLPVWHLGGTKANINDYFGTSNNADIQISTNNDSCSFNPQKQKMIITKEGYVGIGSYNTSNPTRPSNKFFVQNGKIHDPYSFLQTNFQITSSSLGILSTSNRDSLNSKNISILGLANNPNVLSNIGTAGFAIGNNVNANDGILAIARGDSSNNTGIFSSANGDGSRNVAVSATASGDNSTNYGVIGTAQGLSYSNTGVSGDGKNSTNTNIGVSGYATDNTNNTPYNTGVLGYAANAAQINKGVQAFVTNAPENQGISSIVIGDNTQNEGVYSYVFGVGANSMNSGITTWVEGSDNHIFNTNNNYSINKFNAGVIGQVRGDNSINVALFGLIQGGVGSSGITNANSDCIGNIGSVRVANTHSSIGVLGEVLDYTSSTFNYGVVGRQPLPLGPTTGTLSSCLSCPVSFSGYFEGDIFCAATYYYSDPKLKTNVQDYKGAISKLRQLNIKQYTFKNDEYAYLNMPQGIQVGVLSTEMKQVFPNLVKNSISPGIGLNRKDLYFEAVNYNALIPILIQAVKELDDKTFSVDELDVLRKANDELRNSIIKLQQQIDELKK